MLVLPPWPISSYNCQLAGCWGFLNWFVGLGGTQCQYFIAGIAVEVNCDVNFHAYNQRHELVRLNCISKSLKLPSQSLHYKNTSQENHVKQYIMTWVVGMAGENGMWAAQNYHQVIHFVFSGLSHADFERHPAQQTCLLRIEFKRPGWFVKKRCSFDAPYGEWHDHATDEAKGPETCGACLDSHPLALLPSAFLSPAWSRHAFVSVSASAIPLSRSIK